MNSTKYVLMNEADFVFSNDDTLIEVSYVEPSFLEGLMSGSWFQVLMAYKRMIWTKWYDMWNMLCVVCKIISLMMHVTLTAWLSKSKICRSIHIPNPNFVSQLTWLSINHVVRNELFFLMHVTGVCVHITILSTSVY